MIQHHFSLRYGLVFCHGAFVESIDEEVLEQWRRLGVLRVDAVDSQCRRV